MLSRASRLFSQVLSCAVAAWAALPSATAATPGRDAEPPAITAGPGAGSAAAPADPCQALKKQLRWHEPFFGLSTWPEAAHEALAQSPPACRQAIAAGQAPGVAKALHDLEAHSAVDGAPLRRFVYRLTCQLRVPEARRQVLDGLHEPSSYADCADALFAMPWSDREALELRERYVEGLRTEPLKTHLPSGILQPPFAERLAPVLAAYDKAQRIGRDALYHAVCEKEGPLAAEAQSPCAGPAQREPEWAMSKLLAGELDAGLDRFAALSPEQRLPFAAVLKLFDAEKRPGRDRLYRAVCGRGTAASEPAIGAACSQLLPNAEARWLARDRAERMQAEVDAYYHGGRLIASILLGLSALLFAHGVLTAQKRRRQLMLLR